MEPIGEALRAALLGASAIGMGLAVLPRDARSRRISSFGGAFAFGSALLSIICLLPVAPARGPLGIAWLVAAVACLGLGAWWRWRARPDAGRPSPPRARLGRGPAWIGLAVFAAGGALLHLAFAFQTRLDYDELSYHLPLASHFAQAFAGEWPMFYGRLPMLVPSLTRFVTSPDGAGTGAAMLHAFAIIAGASCTHRVAAQLGARGAGRMLASVLYLWHPMVIDASSKHLTDPWVALYSAAACEALLGAFLRRRDPSAPRHVLLAFMCGAAVAVKFGALGLVAAPLALIWAVGVWVRRQAWPGWRAAGAMILAGALPVAIWLIPPPEGPDGYPSADFMHRQRARVVEVHHPQSPLQHAYWATAGARLGLPAYTLRDVVQPGIILDIDLPPLAGSVSFLLLGAVGCLLAPRNPSSGALLAAALASWLVLLLVRDNPGRFWIGALPWLCAPCGAWLGGLGRRSVLRVLVRPVIAACLAGIIAGQWRMLEYRLWVPDGARWDARLAELGPGYAEAVLAARSAQDGGRVLVLFDGRNHLFGASAEPVTAWDPPPSLARAVRSAASGGQLAARLRSAGVTHVFVNEAELGRILSFYARDRLASDPRGAAGNRSESFEAELRAFPAFELLGMTEAKSEALADLLRTARRRATIGVPAGPRSEIWLAPIPAPGDEGR